MKKDKLDFVHFRDKSREQQEVEEKAPCKTTWPFVGKIFSVRCDLFHLPSNEKREREIVVHPGAVVLLPLKSEHEIILVKQYRRPAARILLELPAGMLEKEEAPKERAMKELQEETGYRAEELIEFGEMFSAPGFCTEYLHFFLAKGLHPAPLPTDADEAIDFVTLCLQEALEMIDQGTICDAKTIAGILKYVRMLNT